MHPDLVMTGKCEQQELTHAYQLSDLQNMLKWGLCIHSNVALSPVSRRFIQSHRVLRHLHLLLLQEVQHASGTFCRLQLSDSITENTVFMPVQRH